MSSESEYSCFGDFVRFSRFVDSGALDRFKAYVKVFIDSKHIESQILVVHSPYLEISHANHHQDFVDSDNASGAGLGTGKTDLLEIASRHLTELRFNVCAFEKIGKRIDEFDSFYQDIFLDWVTEQDPHLLISRRQKILDRAEFFWSRFSLLVSAALTPLAIVIAYLLTWLGFRSIEFVAAPSNVSFLLKIVQPFITYQYPLLILGCLVLILWIPYSWGSLQRSKDLHERWNELGIVYRASQSTKSIEEILVNQPEKILRSVSKKSRHLAILLDDVGAIDEASFKKFVNLADVARDKKLCKLLIILTYTPTNPVLRRSDRHWLQSELSLVRITERGWVNLELAAITKGQLTNLLWEYYQDEKAEYFQHLLEATYTEARSNTGLLLAFFRFEDKKLGSRELFLALNEAVINAHFDQFLNYDRRAVTQILDSVHVYAQENAQECLETLKYILAHRNHAVSVTNLAELVAGNLQHNVEIYLEILSSNEIDMLQISNAGSQRYVDFRYRYLYAILYSGWQEWRQNCEVYFSAVFHYLHSSRDLAQDDEELAIRSLPTKLAVDVLWRAGEYYYRFAGSSPAGTALRYYEDALHKLLYLLNTPFDEKEGIWNLVRTNNWDQKSRAKYNPLRQWSKESYSISRYGNNLLIFHLTYIVGRLYWIQGNWQAAEKLWMQQWPEVVRKLSSHVSSEKDRTDLMTADLEINIARIEMLYVLGSAPGWDEVIRICSLATTQAKLSNRVSILRLYELLTAYYRRVGVGNELRPYRFLRSTPELTELTSLLSEQSLPVTDKLRLLNLCANAYWQLIEVDLPDLSDINLTRSYELKFDHSAWNSLKDIFAKQTSLFIEKSESRLKRRESWILWPDARSEEAWFLIWEGHYLLYRFYDFRLTIVMYYMDAFDLLQRKSDKTKYLERLNTWLSIVHKMETYLQNIHVKDFHIPDEFANRVYKLQKSVDSVAQDKRARQRTTEENFRREVEKLYQLGANAFQQHSMKRMNYAELAFRDIGHQAGVMASKHGKFRIAQATSSEPAAFGIQPAWLSEARRFLRDNDGGLGYHLDSFQAQLSIGLWGQNHDILLANRSYLGALKWIEEPTLRLPKVLNGEINYLVGMTLGNSELKADTPEDIIPYFDIAKTVFDSVGNESEIISNDLLVERQIDVMWWRAELLVRFANHINDFTERQRLLNRAVRESDFVINRAKKISNKQFISNTARIVRAQARYMLDEQVKAFEECKVAVDYFISENNSFWSLQSLTLLISFHRPHSLKDKKGRQFQDEVQNKYGPQFIEVLKSFDGKREQLTYMEKLAFYRGCVVGGQVVSSLENSIYWLETGFSILESLGLYGTALNLTPRLRERYQRLSDPQKLVQFQTRLLLALQKFDPRNDVVPNANVLNSILNDLGLKSPYAVTEHLKTKEEIVQTVELALTQEKPDYNQAIVLLVKASDLRLENLLEEIDLEVLTLLRSCYYKISDINRAKETSDLLTKEHALAQCCALFNLAMHFKSIGVLYRSLLISATISPIDSDCYRRATIELTSIGVEEGVEEEPENVPLVDEELEQLILSKPSNQFSQQECGSILHLLENEMREFIAYRLTSITNSWWKQRLPVDIRSRAEERKRDRENRSAISSNRTFRNYDFLDFTDIPRIITVRNNWEETFKEVFPSQDFVMVKLREISTIRNDIAHNRQVEPLERDILVNTARQLINLVRGSRFQQHTTNEDEIA